jgi:hypothetical protein
VNFREHRRLRIGSEIDVSRKHKKIKKMESFRGHKTKGSRGGEVKGVGVMKDEDLKLEEIGLFLHYGFIMLFIMKR